MGAPVDLEMFRAMLARARIPHEEGPTQTAETTQRSAVPEGSTSIRTPGEAPWWGSGAEPQPYPGGYSGFFAEAVFGPDGTLLAIWAWE
jgi:hypothetical protein